jgi:quercetin dioxygenase-like cupin family protein
MTRTVTAYSLAAAVAMLAGGLAHANPSATSQQALFYTTKDSRLEWRPCPAFLPKGCEIAVLHGNPAGPNADIFFRVPPDSKIPRHWHTSAERMILVSGEMHLTYDGQSTQVIEPGTYIYGPAKLPHEGSCASGDPCVLFIAFEQPVDAIPFGQAAK